MSLPPMSMRPNMFANVQQTMQPDMHAQYTAALQNSNMPDITRMDMPSPQLQKAVEELYQCDQDVKKACRAALPVAAMEKSLKAAMRLAHLADQENNTDIAKIAQIPRRVASLSQAMEQVQLMNPQVVMNMNRPAFNFWTPNADNMSNKPLFMDKMLRNLPVAPPIQPHHAFLTSGAIKASRAQPII